jgi:hypothetical protein
MNTESGEPNWRILYRAGATAPLIALAFYLSQFAIVFSGATYPTTPEGWFVLLQHSKLLGLFFLNALDVISIALLGCMFLALYVALRHTHPSITAIAAFFALLGIAVFVSSRTDAVSATLSLNDQYAAAATEAQRSQVVTAAQAVFAPTRATPETAGFFFVAVAGLLFSLVTLRSAKLSRVAAYVGLLAGLVTVADDISVVVAPMLTAFLMPINGLLWLVWWLLISRGLFRLAGTSRAKRDSA